MTIKLSLLKSGEDVIADIQEMIVGEGENARVIGYFFENPCIVKVFAKDYEEKGQMKAPCQLQLTPWMPLTNDSKIPVPPDWIVTLVEPIPQLKEMYKNGVLKNVKDSQNDSVDESADTVESD